jgi:hypothetical protein
MFGVGCWMLKNENSEMSRGVDGLKIHRAVRRLHRFIPLCYSCAVIALIE